jgi:hypothetical protein
MFRYAKLLSVPPSTRDASAIDIDIPRTFKGDDSFSSRVNPESLRRVLYSYSSHCNEQGLGLSYIQGLNTICGMLLFNNSELNAFFCLCAFTLRFAPSHYEANIAGAHRVASCCDELLKHVDSEAIHFIARFRFFQALTIMQLNVSLSQRGCSSVVLALPAILVSSWLCCMCEVSALNSSCSLLAAAGNR